MQTFEKKSTPCLKLLLFEYNVILRVNTSFNIIVWNYTERERKRETTNDKTFQSKASSIMFV